MNKDVVVWGAGFMHKQETPRGKADRICAVRGPLSRARLSELGIECPDVLGDPALLIPDYFHPSDRTSFRLGIVPHEVDFRSETLRKFKDDPGIKVIDIRAGISKVIEDITSCARIASSSLHALIIADCYEIPWVWIELSNKVGGNGFKFCDYLLSTGRSAIEPLRVNEDTGEKELARAVKRDRFTLDLAPLREACPFSHC